MLSFSKIEAYLLIFHWLYTWLMVYEDFQPELIGIRWTLSGRFALHLKQKVKFAELFPHVLQIAKKPGMILLSS